MASLRQHFYRLLHHIAPSSSAGPASPSSRKSARLLAAHHKVVLLGTGLLSSCLAVAAMGIWGVNTIRRDHAQLTSREVPALALLLQIDTDLYQAQLGLERAMTAADSAQKKAGLDFFTQNITESQHRFITYKKSTTANVEETAAIQTYEADRLKWMQAAETLQSALADAHMPGQHADRSDPTVASQAASVTNLFETTQNLFETMRSPLNRIIVDVYQPAIAASGERADRDASLTFWKLSGGMLVALLAGIALTRNMALALKLQQRAADSMNAEREKQNRRQTFETRLSRGLEMAQDESAALNLAKQAIAAGAPTVAAEILLADSSRAHLLQVITTDEEHHGRGCGVPKPSDCPAVWRGHRLNFESAAAMDACPNLKGRPGGNCSAVCIPLSIMGQTVGVLHATAAEGVLPPEDHILALEQVASKAGERLGLLRAFRRTEAQASSDPLTGLMNRRSLEEKVHELTVRQVPFAVAYGDLDHFKNLNDTHGHETGDKALRTFAQVLKSTIRPGDLVARWGGEEFILVLPRASATDAAAVLDRVRQALAVLLQGADTPVFTVSFGVAQSADGTLFTDVLASADESLLQAKRDGRNRTVTATSGPLSTAA